MRVLWRYFPVLVLLSVVLVPTYVVAANQAAATTLVVPPYPPNPLDIPVSSTATVIHFDCVLQKFTDAPSYLRYGSKLQVILQNENPYKYSYTVANSQTNLYNATAPSALNTLIGSSSAANFGVANPVTTYQSAVTDLLQVAKAVSDISTKVYSANDLAQVYKAMDSAAATTGSNIATQTPPKDLLSLVAYLKSLSRAELKAYADMIASDDYKALTADQKAALTTSHQQAQQVSTLTKWFDDFTSHFASGIPLKDGFSYPTQTFTVSGDDVQITVTAAPTQGYLSVVPGAQTVASDPQAVHVYGRAVVDYSAGLSATGLTNITYYKNSSNAIAVSNRSFTDLGVAAYAHFVPSTGLLFNHQASLALTIGAATTSNQPRYLVGASLGFGRATRIYLTGGLALGNRSVLADGQAVGQNLGASGTVAALDSVLRPSWFVGLSFQFASTSVSSNTKAPATTTTSPGGGTGSGGKGS